jgi:tetratricopeptide (TPR) repeat protein
MSSPGTECRLCRLRRRTGEVLRTDSFAITVLSVVAVVLFVGTHFVARTFERTQYELAQMWFERGQGELRAGRVDHAIRSLSTALAYSRENFQFRLRLAQALVQAQQLRQAQSYLRALWEQQPGHGAVNLELARIAARSGEYNQALRFYHGAIFGVWEDNPEERRREVRFELIQYLLRTRAVEQAQSELIALAADLPRDPALLVRVGDLFLQAREFRRALEQYREALRIQPRNTEALLGAGQAAFELEQYRDAQRYLQRALAQDPKDVKARELLQLSTLVRQFDPFIPRLSARERARRVVEAYRNTEQRLTRCAVQRGEKLTQAGPSPTKLQSEYIRLRELRPNIRASALMRNPDFADTVMDAVGQAQQTTAGLCGPPTGVDQALLMITRQREAAEP